MIMIRLKFYSGLAKYKKNNKNVEDETVLLEKKETIRNILNEFLSDEIIDISSILVNNRLENLDYQVIDRDDIGIYLLASGG